METQYTIPGTLVPVEFLRDTTSVEEWIRRQGWSKLTAYRHTYGIIPNICYCWVPTDLWDAGDTMDSKEGVTFVGTVFYACHHLRKKEVLVLEGPQFRLPDGRFVMEPSLFILGT